jgi:aerotaxis receptor
MRKNLPVSNVEVALDDDRAIVSKTDLDGNITYVNPYFCEVSGFTEAELIGQPQNIVRHPDMPRAAFADLWAAVRAGTPWTGLVKNRCKNGDYYWVRANVTPIAQAGQVVGYMSVRVKPSRAQVDAVAAGYARVNAGNAAVTVQDGQLVGTGLLARIIRLTRVSLRQRIWLATSVVNLLLLALCVSSLGSAASAATYANFGATLAGLLINVYLWHTLRTNMMQPLERALLGARAIAAGDLTANFDTDARDEMGQLLTALQQMNCNLMATIGDVRSNVDTMALSTSEIAAGNADLSARTEAQAASLEETASSVEQFSATVKQNADSAISANALAAKAAQVAVQGGALMAEVVHTMDEIDGSSRRIVDIIGLIEAIAFQTNILALNAAVEAARAGEQGRGFAVVASEVRNLAQRSAVAAKDIKQLIDESLSKVGVGLSQVRRAGDTMDQVVTSAQEVTGIMQHIATASREQSLGVEQVNSAVAHMDQVTQQNAALVEQAAAAAASLAQEARQLTRAVSVFNLRASAAPARVAARRPAPPAAPKKAHPAPRLVADERAA